MQLRLELLKEMFEEAGRGPVGGEAHGRDGRPQ